MFVVVDERSGEVQIFKNDQVLTIVYINYIF